MFVSLAVELGQCLSHHVQLRLAVPLEYRRVSLPKHLGDKMVRDSPGAESGSKGMAQLDLTGSFCTT